MASDGTRLWIVFPRMVICVWPVAIFGRQPVFVQQHVGKATYGQFFGPSRMDRKSTSHMGFQDMCDFPLLVSKGINHWKLLEVCFQGAEANGS